MFISPSYLLKQIKKTAKLSFIYAFTISFISVLYFLLYFVQYKYNLENHIFLYYFLFFIIGFSALFFLINYTKAILNKDNTFSINKLQNISFFEISNFIKYFILFFIIFSIFFVFPYLILFPFVQMTTLIFSQLTIILSIFILNIIGIIIYIYILFIPFIIIDKEKKSFKEIVLYSKSLIKKHILLTLFHYFLIIIFNLAITTALRFIFINIFPIKDWLLQIAETNIYSSNMILAYLLFAFINTFIIVFTNVPYLSNLYLSYKHNKK